MTRLQSLMPKTKTTQGKLARSLGVSRVYLNSVLHGHAVPSASLMFALAGVLGAEVCDLWELTDVGVIARDADNRRPKPRVRRAV